MNDGGSADAARTGTTQQTIAAGRSPAGIQEALTR